MKTRAMNFKLDEADILDMKQVASVFNMTVTDVIREAVREYVGKMKKDPFYRLVTNVQEASAEETSEVLEQIENLSDDDLTISSTERLFV